MQAKFSPDGQWVAYASDESGRYEVYARSFSGTAGKFQISNNRGSQPRWRGDGKELYYLSPEGKMMAVTVKTTADTLERETPRLLFEARWLSGATTNTYLYDVTADGQRFLAIARADADNTQPLTLITNWQAGLKR
jgi:Tol biopolymer transport system component